jgi:hypothetical protein
VVCGSVWTSAVGATLRAEAKVEAKETVWKTSATSCVSRTAEMVGGGMDHMRSVGSAFGMKSEMTGSDVVEEAVKRTMEDGMEQPVK